MSIEQTWSGKLQRFTIIDIALVKAVYFLFGLLVYSVYAPLAAVDWWFWLVFLLIGAFPLMLHYFGARGNVLDKGRAFLASNTPALQVLLFLTQFFAAFMLADLLPVLASGKWWVYVGLIGLLAIKPMTKTVFW